jgi:hypothetical protein
MSLSEEGTKTDSQIQNLPFQKVEHRVDTLDAQPSNTSGGILVVVTGALLVGIRVFGSHSECATADESFSGRGGEAGHVLCAELPASA